MNIKTDDLLKLQTALNENGYNVYAGLVSNCINKYRDRNTKVIGFVGDYSSGKSTVINSLLERDVIPTGNLPYSTETTIKYGEEEKVVVNSSKTIELKELAKLNEDGSKADIYIRSDVLKENALEFKEFQGLLSKKKLNNMELMSEIYKCDAVVLIMSAANLFSETERMFINNYIQYVGREHLLLVISKLSQIEDEEKNDILKYIQNQIDCKFEGVRWTISENKKEKVYLPTSEYVGKNIKEQIISLYDKNDSFNEVPINNMLGFIRSRLENDIHLLEKENGEKEKKIETKNKKLYVQKQLEEGEAENAALEFRQKSNETLKRIDSYIKNQFNVLAEDTVKCYLSAPDKYDWFKNKLELYYKTRLSEISEASDKYVLQELESDTDELNKILQTSLSIYSPTVEMSGYTINKNEEVKPYAAYKKYLPIGIGGGMLVGLQTFRLIGAAICLGGGIILFTYIKAKDKMQDEEIIKKMRSDTRDLSSRVRKLVLKDVNESYNSIISEFKKEARNIIDKKYYFTVNVNTDLTEKIEKISNIITMLKENE